MTINLLTHIEKLPIYFIDNYIIARIYVRILKKTAAKSTVEKSFFDKL